MFNFLAAAYVYSMPMYIYNSKLDLTPSVSHALCDVVRSSSRAAGGRGR